MSLETVDISSCCQAPIYVEFTDEMLCQTLKDMYSLTPGKDFPMFTPVDFCSTCSKPCKVIVKIK